jgi:hypothetical protein
MIAAQAKANSSPITLEQIQAELGGTLGGPQGHVGGDPDRVMTSIDLGAGGGVISIHVILDPSSADGIYVHAPAKALLAADDYVRTRLGLPLQRRAANDNDEVAFKVTPYQWRSTQDTPLREFLYGKHLIRGYITNDVAPGGVGKSSNVIVDALAMVTGQTLLGDESAAKLRVWLWNGEDPREEIERRVAAACAYYGISEADIGGRLFIDTGREQEIVIATEDRNSIVLAKPVIAAVKAAIRENKIDVFIVDPFVTTHGVPENDNTKIAAVAKQWAYIADVCQCAVQIVHHVRKGDSKREITVEDMRGAGALSNAARAVRLLSPMTAKEAKSAGLKPGERFSYFKVINGKSNLTPRSGHAEWRELASQPMGNGKGLTRPQDHVGVVRCWRWPTAASAVDGVPAEALEAIKAKIRGGDYKEHQLAANWAGLAVAEVLKLDLADVPTKQRVKQMLVAWIADGHFKIEVRRDPAKREDKKYIVVADAITAPV